LCGKVNPREFEPGVLPPTLDLGDKFVWEDKTYKVKGASSGGWIWEVQCAAAGTVPQELVMARRE